MNPPSRGAILRRTLQLIGSPCHHVRHFSTHNAASLRTLVGAPPPLFPQPDIHLVVDSLNMDLSGTFEYLRVALSTSDFSPRASAAPPGEELLSFNALRDVFVSTPYKFMCIDEASGTFRTERCMSLSSDGAGSSPTISTMRTLATLNPNSLCVTFEVEAGPESGDYFCAALVGRLHRYYAQHYSGPHQTTRPRRPLFVILTSDQLFRRSLERCIPGSQVVYPPALTPPVLVPFLASLSEEGLHPDQ